MRRGLGDGIVPSDSNDCSWRKERANAEMDAVTESRNARSRKTHLVTGGAGFIGSHLVEALLATGSRVIVLDDLSTGSLDNLSQVRSHPDLEVVVGDVTDDQLLADCFQSSDGIFHLAAIVGVQLVLDQPMRTVDTNVRPVETLLRLLEDRPIPLFVASTSEVCGKSPASPMHETSDIVLGPTNKSRWIYACSKAIDEFLALDAFRRFSAPVVVGRFFNTVGPRQAGTYGMVMARFIEQAIMGGPITVFGDGRQVRSFAHVSDVVSGVLGLMNCPQAIGQVVNIGAEEPISIMDLARRVANTIDPSVQIDLIPYSQAYSNGFEDVRRRVADLTRIRGLIGYAPRNSLDDIINDIVAWKMRSSEAVSH